MRDPGRIIPPPPKPPVDPDDPRRFVFKNRGALLAVPALALGIFGRPSAASIAVGLPIAFAGELLRCWAVGYSGKTTREDFVTAPKLTTAGPYAYTRNPLYIGNAITALGFALAFTGKNSTPARLALIAGGLGAMLAVYATIVPLEEAYLSATFGDDYDAYAERVPRIGPLAEPAEPAEGAFDPGVIAEAETNTFASLLAMCAVLAVRARGA